MRFEQDETFKDFGLNRKESDYVKNLLLNMTKKEAYSKAFGISNITSASTEASKLEKRKGEQLEAYKKHLTMILQEEEVVSLKQIMVFLYDLMRSEDTKTKDKIRCAEDLIKMQGGFLENVNVNADIKQVLFTNEENIQE